MNEVVAAHNIGSYVPMVDGPDKVSGDSRTEKHRLDAK